MKTRTIILALVLLTSSQFSTGQDAPEPCSFTTIMEVEAEANPIYQRSWFNLEKRLQEMQEAAPLRNDEVFTIPVVVHVIHTGEAIGSGPNIPDEQVFSAIQALNEDFRKIAGTNGDGIGVDTGIEFCLAVRDPQGNSTTGIVRVDGSVLPAYAADGIQATGDVGAPELEVKSLSNWPIQDYMNIWVVSEIEGNNAQSGIQGYSRFPVNSIVDGLVVLYNAIGTVGNIKSSTALNRTVTHEVGHYLGLYHTFHLTNNCNGESNCNTQGDRVCDTPQTVSSPSCSTQGCGNQQVENYLDYTPQTCMNAFTEGQRTRMRNTILADRSSLLESIACVSVHNNDAGITSVSHPSGSLCSAQVNPAVRLTNFGSQTLTSCTIHYATNNTVFANFAWSGSIAPSTSLDVELPMISGTMGENLFSAWTTNPNGVADEGPDNDEFELPFSVSTGETVTVSVNVDFFGQESTWEIKQGDTVMASGGPFQNYSQGSIFSESVCLAHGCYTFFMYDSHGDGMSFTIGSYEVVNSEGTVLASGGGNFGYEAEHLFCLDAPDEPEEPDPVPPIAGFTASNTSGCGNANVTFTNTSSGATSYAWSFPGGSPSSSTANNPTVAYNSPGNYSVTLTATNSDGSTSITQNNVVTVFSHPTASISAAPITCNGANNGGLTASASGGGGGFQYQWSNNATGASLSNLAPGNYTVTVTDANGCTATASQNLTNPPAMNVTLFKSDITCNGLNNGSVNATANGGSQPYTYSWSHGATTSNVSGLAAGSYTLTVTDANGCQGTSTVQIAEPTELVLNIDEITAETCDGNNGSAVLNAMGGTAPLTIQWSNGSLGQHLTGASAGTNLVTVTDANGCTVQDVIDIPYDCEEAPDGTRLTDDFCSATGLTLDDMIECIPVEDAVLYHWRFSSASNGFQAEGYTAENNTEFVLEHVSQQLAYGMVVGVSIRIQNEAEIWSEWGQQCFIAMAETIPLTTLESTDCNAEFFQPGTLIMTEVIAGAQAYEWAFYDGADSTIFTTFLPQLPLPVGEPLEEGQLYTISVRSEVANQWSDWGSECDVQFGEGTSVRDLDENDPHLQFWPNPNSGERISFRYRNLFTSDPVIELEVYDGSGKLVENKRLSHLASQGELTIQFNRRLQPGMYFLRTRTSERIFEEKIIVQ